MMVLVLAGLQGSNEIYQAAALDGAQHRAFLHHAPGDPEHPDRRRADHRSARSRSST
jgi:hypothetical protein